MIDALPGKRYGALHAWPDGEVWRYLPVAPSPQRGPDGRAQLTAIEANDMLMLTLGTSLIAGEAQLAEARSAIAAETGAEEAAIDLRPADATPRGATLTLTLDGEAPVELARANPSPLAPYSAAFSAMLRGDQAKQANAAMKAGTGRLDVVYDLDLAMTRTVTARVAGDPGAATDAEAALAAGDLTLTYEADAGVSDALKADARRRVVDEVGGLLGRLTQRAATAPAAADSCDGDQTAGFDSDAPPATQVTAAIDAHVTRTEPAPRALRLAANVADWL